MEFNATFLVSIISFILFVYLMNIVLYEPMRRIVLQRKTFIDGNFQAADENHKKAANLTEQKNKKIRDTRIDAKNKYVKAVDTYKEQKDSILEVAKDKSDKELQEAYNDLNNLSNDAKAKLRDRMCDLANDIVEKMIGYRTEVKSFDEDKVNDILYR